PGGRPADPASAPHLDRAAPVRPGQLARVRAVLRFFATFGPVGSAPLAPATAGSAVVAAIGWFIPPPTLIVAIALIAVGAVIAIWCAGEAEKDLGHDAKPIVIDEAVGQSLALLLVPHRLW